MRYHDTRCNKYMATAVQPHVLLGYQAVVVATVDFFPDDGHVALRDIQRIGLPRKPDGRNLNFRLHLARRAGSSEAKMSAGVLVFRRFAG